MRSLMEQRVRRSASETVDFEIMNRIPAPEKLREERGGNHPRHDQCMV